MRGSISYNLSKELIERGNELYIIEPNINEESVPEKIYKYEEVKDLTENIIVGTNHTEFKDYDFEGKKVIKVEISKSLIIPCKNEQDGIKKIIMGFSNAVEKDTEILVVVDDENDPTLNSIPKNIDNVFVLMISDLDQLTPYNMELINLRVQLSV